MATGTRELSPAADAWSTAWDMEHERGLGRDLENGGAAWPAVPIYDAPFWSPEVLELERDLSENGELRSKQMRAWYVHDFPGENMAVGRLGYDDQIQVIDGLERAMHDVWGVGDLGQPITCPSGCLSTYTLAAAACELITSAPGKAACIAAANSAALGCKALYCRSNPRTRCCGYVPPTAPTPDTPPTGEEKAWYEKPAILIPVASGGILLLYLLLR